MQKNIRVLVVDDSALIRTLFTEMLSEAPDIEVIGTATDPFDAREKIKQLNPDVVTLDIEMPKMDGLSFLEKIMTLRPMPVVMASTLTQKGAEETIRALEIGAVDYVSKPQHSQTRSNLLPLQQELQDKVRAAAGVNVGARATRVQPSTTGALAFNPAGGASPYIIAIGSSTGGVEALRDIFLQLPANSPPIVMTQHMPKTFTGSFAARLDSLSEVTVTEATQGARLKTGHAYLAPGDRHLKVRKVGAEFVCNLEESPPVSGHCPSVDVLFDSVADTVGARAIGVILTGMGRDGAKGMLRMRENGAYTVGQNQATCVVYGMPRAAFEAGGVQKQLALSEIAGHVLHYCEQPKKAHG